MGESSALRPAAPSGMILTLGVGATREPHDDEQPEYVRLSAGRAKAATGDRRRGLEAVGQRLPLGVGSIEPALGPLDGSCAAESGRRTPATMFGKRLVIGHEPAGGEGPALDEGGAPKEWLNRIGWARIARVVKGQCRDEARSADARGWPYQNGSCDHGHA